MSVIFAVIHEDFISMCADRQGTNLKTLEADSEQYNKIYQWSPYVGAGFAGNKLIGRHLIESLHNFLHESGESYELEDLPDYVVAGYQTLREVHEFIRDEDHAECIFAGTLSTGKLGLVWTRVGGGEPVTEIYDITSQPIVVATPADLTHAEAYQLFKKAVQNTVHKKNRNLDVFEASLRKAVRYVSEHSTFVGHKSDYIVIHPNPKQSN